MNASNSIRHPNVPTNSADSGEAPIAKDFVYFARGLKSGLIKVGVSRCPEQRCKALRGECGEPTTLLFAYLGTFQDEQSIHARFRIEPGAWASRGTEWYNKKDLISLCVDEGLVAKLQLGAGEILGGAPFSQSTLRRLYGDEE